MVKLYQKEKKIEMYDSVLLDLKDFMTNLLNRTTCTTKWLTSKAFDNTETGVHIMYIGLIL